jgi:hypothetical protein
MLTAIADLTVLAVVMDVLLLLPVIVVASPNCVVKFTKLELILLVAIVLVLL